MKIAIMIRTVLTCIVLQFCSTIAVAEGQSPVMIPVPGKNYEIGKYEVTQAEWQAVMGYNPSKFRSCGQNCPVEKLSWNDIQEFIDKLNAMTGKKFRLPTGEEWEYACYGGKASTYCGGEDLDALAWSSNNSERKTHPVGQKLPNGYGLYDMAGNVDEWTEECDEGDCTMRILRGGGWDDDPQFSVATFKDRFIISGRNDDHGFRLARTLP